MFEDLSIVIPWRDAAAVPGMAGKMQKEWRQRSFSWVVERYHRLFPEAELILADDGSETFNRATFINAGVSGATRAHVLLADADTISYPSFVAEGLVRLHGGAPWVIPYGGLDYYNSDQVSAAEILELDPTSHVTPERITWEYKLESWSGQVLMRTEDFESVGGFDPRFKGWGFEDNALSAACDTLLGDHVRVDDGYAIHIWHPAPVETTWEQPNLEVNRALYAQYDIARGNFDEMQKLVRGIT